MARTPLLWPGGARVAVMLTFDFDAETNWITPDPLSGHRAGRLSQGTYGARVGVPRLLELLGEEALPATFFIPGWVARNRPHPARAIRDGGFEIGHHGYLHKWVSPDDPETEETELMQGLEALEEVLGVRPRGYRSPAGESTPNLIRLLTREGFLYDSSLMDDVDPYRHRAPEGGGSGQGGLPPVELPWHWSLDDAPYFMFGIKSQRPILPNEMVLSVWREEFDALREWGGLYDLVMHPQTIGRPSRLRLLRELIGYMKSFPDVWFATGSEVARAWAEMNESRASGEEREGARPPSPFDVGTDGGDRAG